MSEAPLLVAEYVLEDWLDALRAREPRALELAYALSVALPPLAETGAVRAAAQLAEDATLFTVSPVVREMLNNARDKYDALRHGEFVPVDFKNPNILGFERKAEQERVLIINNLARVSQPCKFLEYAGREGWDILNRVEFTFPTRAQLDPYEFLWLLPG